MAHQESASFQNSSMNVLPSRKPADFPEEQCSFDLMLADGEGEFEMRSNLFGARSTSLSETSRSLEATLNNHRKRKRDKDGFVTPTTPDIPKSSNKQAIAIQESLFEMAPQEEAAHGRDHKRSSWDEGQEKVTLSTADHAKSLHTAELIEPAISSISQSGGGGGNRNHTTDLGQNPETSFSDLFKEIGHEFILLTESCQEFLRESEAFESQSMNKIDKLLCEARKREEILICQKEYLNQRLAAITEHLKHPKEPNL